eukprot:4577196-Amphidinium_carterae.1
MKNFPNKHNSRLWHDEGQSSGHQEVTQPGQKADVPNEEGVPSLCVEDLATESSQATIRGFQR